ncbi:MULTISPECIES: PTS sugar transporter subunit IIC [Enterococcus]|uniref:PTS sugar transporter subunit IIC n=1 Tax=Enterococcus TaxID=1350 RepID=UPI0001F0D2E7|nr:PTS transporter subunit EIIC [Enterococcus faecalis]EFT95521.1 putative PTS system, cellobiose-specific IIC component [Enterococcus faecalis TX0012]
MTFTDKISTLLMPFSSKMANQRHLVAIRDSFIDITPIIMANSLFILLNALIFSNIKQLSSLSALASMVNNGTMGIMTIYLTFLIGYRLANFYITAGDIDSKYFNPIHAGILSLALTLIMFPLINPVTLEGSQKVVNVTGVYLQTLTSSGGMFVGIIAGLLGTELLLRLSKNKKLRISMPDGVPPAVSDSFNSLIPECLVIIIFAVITFTFVETTGMTIPSLIEKLISAPLQYAMESPLGLFVVQLLTQVLWFFGLHGQNIVSSVTSPSMLTAIQQNMDAFSAGHTVPNIVTNPWIGMYTLLGGTGAILPLLIAIFIGSKRKDYREIGKLGLLPSIFNISEPIMFGIPIVMNPFFVIPFITIPLINLAIAYPLTVWGIVAKSVVIPPWILPPILTAWVTTAGDIPATLLSAALFILDIFLYLPFVIASNKEITNIEK